MNANEIPPKGNARMNRIKIASKILRILIIISTAVPCLFVLAGCWFGWASVCPNGMKIRFSEHQIYTSPFEIPDNVLALALVKFGLYIFCALVLCRLLRLYEQGKYFTAKNVTYIRFLGYYLIIDSFVNFQLDSLSHNEVITITFTQPFTGLVIIFIAWIMDEGRKIQEEQELTV
jgi:hypothetical protein